ncbi:MAG: hypothetical protein ABJG78_02935 [Cyclobacteriaceae bacterium]
MNYMNNRKTQGVDFTWWAERINEILSKDGMGPITDSNYLTELYNQDLTYDDVVFKEQCKYDGLRSVNMRVIATHRRGTFEKTFPNSAHAKHWFKNFQEVREKFENGSDQRELSAREKKQQRGGSW